MWLSIRTTLLDSGLSRAFAKLRVRVATVAAIGVVVCAAVGFVGRAYSERAVRSFADAERARLAAPGELAQGPPASRPAQLIRVFVHDFDIYPDVVRTRPGKIQLRAENETREDIALVVERVRPGQSPEPLTRIKTVSRGKRAQEELALGVGEYVFYDAS